MLKDRYFYPLALSFIAAMIWFAMSKADYEILTKEMISEQGFAVQNQNLSTLTASPGTSYIYTEKTSSEKAFVTMMTNVARSDAPASAGIFAPLGPDYEDAFANRKLRITVRARQGRTDPLKHFDMGYFTSDVGDTGWIKKPLTSDWENYTIEFSPNPPVNDLGVDYFGIWPGEEGEKKTMDVQFMKIDVIPKLRRQ